MSLGKRILVPALIAIAALASQEASAQGSSGKSGSSTSKRRARPPRATSSLEIGASYLIWNEPLNVSQGGVDAKGNANFGGLGLVVDKNWMKGRWLWGGSLGYAMGKASGDNFGSGVNWVDGIDRPWWAAQATGFGHYRVNTTFMIGLGVLGRYRVVGWASIDPTISAASLPNTQITGQLLLRWRVAQKVTFIQSYTPLGLSGASMWQWTAQFIL